MLKPGYEDARLAADAWVQEIEAAGNDQTLILKVGPPPNTGSFASDWEKFKQAQSTYWDTHFGEFDRATLSYTQVIRDEDDPSTRKQAILNFLVAAKKVDYSYANRVLKMHDIPWMLNDLKGELREIIQGESEDSF